MPKVAKEKTQREMDSCKSPGLYSAGGVAGLQLQVTETGGKSWILRICLDGKRRDIGLGSYADYTVDRARIKAKDFKLQHSLKMARKIGTEDIVAPWIKVSASNPAAAASAIVAHVFSISASESKEDLSKAMQSVILELFGEQ